MGTKKILLLFYLMYTCYTILVCGTTDLTFLYMLPALLFVWLFYIFFAAGFALTSRQNKYQNDIKNEDELFGLVVYNCKNSKLIFLGILCIAMSVICARFYTGQTPYQVISNLFSGLSNYQHYQGYFHNTNLQILSLKKLLYILLLGIKNIIFVYSFIFIICKAAKIKPVHILYLIMCAIAHLYFGVARGTNFESYQLFLLVSYAYVQRKQVQHKKVNVLLIIVLGLVLVSAFFATLQARGVTPNYQITEHIHYEPNEIFSRLFSNFSLYYMHLYSYLGFGMYYIATLINEIWFSSIEGFVGAFIPAVNTIYGIEPIKITNELVVIGVKWVPHSVRIINVVGVVGLFLICYFVGSFLKKISYKQVQSNGYYLLFGYFIFAFLTTIPTGSFVEFSSEKILIAYTCLRYFFYSRRLKIKFRFNKYLSR